MKEIKIIVVAVIAILIAQSCAPKYGCPAVQGMAGYGPYKEMKK